MKSKSTIVKRALLMVSAALLLLTQCRKPSVEFPVPEDDNTVSMTVTVGHGRTDITNTGAITWAEGDRLYVAVGGQYKGFLTLIQGGGGSATGTFRGNVSGVSQGSPTFHFFYLGSVDYTTTLEKGTSESVDIDFSSQTGLREDLSRCHVGHGSATGTVDGSGNVTFTETVQMRSMVAIAYLEFKDGGADYKGALKLSGTHIYNKMTVGFDSTSTTKTEGSITLANCTSAQKYVMLVPPTYAGGVTEEETLEFSGGATGSTTLYRGIEANKLYRNASGGPIGVSVKAVPHTLPGVFTVGPNPGDKVWFSKGNLQYLGTGTSGTQTSQWRFADNQWDYMGDGPESGTTKQGNVTIENYSTYNTGSGVAGPDETDADMQAARDLFGWGTTGYQDTRTSSSGYQNNYQPYSTCKTSATSGTEAYTCNRYGYGPDYDATNKYGLSVEHKSDWGMHFNTDDENSHNTGWRTLSSGSGGEWEWLLGPNSSPSPGTNCRTTSVTISGVSNARYSKVKIEYATGNTINGLLIYPDSGFAWDETAMGTAPASTNVNAKGVAYSGTYTESQFRVMERAGAVFLPAAGIRNKATQSLTGDYGDYWSATPYNATIGYNLRFSGSDMTPVASASDRYGGKSVRLVWQ